MTTKVVDVIIEQEEILRQQDAAKKDATARFSAVLCDKQGIFDISGVPTNSMVPGKASYDYALIYGDGVPTTYRNRGKVGHVGGTPVYLGWNEDSNELEIISVNYDYLPQGYEGDLQYDGDKHALRHLMSGDDPLYIYPRAIAWLRTVVHDGTLLIDVMPHVYRDEYGHIIFYPGEKDIDLTSFMPTSGNMRSLLVYLDQDTNAVGFVSGAQETDVPSAKPALPATPAPLHSYPSAVLYLRYGETLTEADSVEDIRIFLNQHYTLHQRAFSGAIVETISIAVTESAGTVSLSLEAEGGGDLHLMFSDDLYDFDSTPAATVALTSGTSGGAPVLNYVYIPKSTMTLTASTGGWPSTEHCPVATVCLLEAAETAANGAIKVHAWTDHLSSSNGQGHLAHINRWIRERHATWLSGVVPTLTIVTASSPDDVYFSNAVGSVMQLHPHAYPVKDMSTGDVMYVVNDSADAYKTITNLNTALTDSTGTSMSGAYFWWVVWGVVSEDSGDCQLMLNLPNGSYTTQASAENDIDLTADYSIPVSFRGCGFLIVAYLMKHSVAGGGTFTIEKTVDLRGLTPTTQAGGGSAGGGGNVEPKANQVMLEGVEQADVNTAFTNATAGQAVRLGPGTFTWDGSTDKPAGVKLLGAGRDATTLSITLATGTKALTLSSTSLIKDMAIVWASTTNTTGGVDPGNWMIEANGGGVIEDCYLRYTNSAAAVHAAVYLASSGVVLRNVEIDQAVDTYTAQGIRADGITQTAYLERVTIGGGQYGILVESGGALTVVNAGLPRIDGTLSAFYSVGATLVTTNTYHSGGSLFNYGINGLATKTPITADKLVVWDSVTGEERGALISNLPGTAGYRPAAGVIMYEGTTYSADASGLQSAINAANTAGGGTVFIGGTVSANISTTITWPGGVYIEGHAGAVLNLAGSTATTLFSLTSSTPKLSNLTVAGTIAANASQSYVFSAGTTVYFKIENCLIGVLKTSTQNIDQVSMSTGFLEVVNSDIGGNFGRYGLYSNGGNIYVEGGSVAAQTNAIKMDASSFLALKGTLISIATMSLNAAVNLWGWYLDTDGTSRFYSHLDQVIRADGQLWLYSAETSANMELLAGNQLTDYVNISGRLKVTHDSGQTFEVTNDSVQAITPTAQNATRYMDIFSDRSTGGTITTSLRMGNDANDFAAFESVNDGTTASLFNYLQLRLTRASSSAYPFYAYNNAPTGLLQLLNYGTLISLDRGVPNTWDDGQLRIHDAGTGGGAGISLHPQATGFGIGVFGISAETVNGVYNALRLYSSSGRNWSLPRGRGTWVIRDSDITGSGAWATITFTTQLGQNWDTSSPVYWDSATALYAKYTGWYYLQANAQIYASTGGIRIYSSHWATHVATVSNTWSALATLGYSVSALVYVAHSTYFQMQQYAGGAGATVIYISPSSPTLAAHFLGD